MCVRKLALAVGLVGALGAQMAAALGLGEIKLNSTLNQPLNAEIKLLQVRNLTEEEILVSLAEREDFDRAGVERTFFLSDLRFKVVLNHPSGPIVRVTTRKPVREPYLNFLLETQWPTGRLLREYTVLMDLPVFADEPAAPVRGAAPRQPERPAAAPSQPQPEAQTPPVRRTVQPAPAPRSQPGRVTPSRSVDVYGPVARNDTLWEIALRVRPDRSVSVQQTMLALQRMNPGAFINNNINLLRSGQVLRVPSLEEIYSMSTRQAVAEVAQQNAQWSEGATGGGEVTGAPLQAGRTSSSAAPAQTTGRGRVSLGAPGDAEGADSGRGSGAVDGDTEALQNELAITLEELDKTQRDNTELTSRITELEAQIETMERLVDVSQQELRALQLASQQRAEAEATDAAEPGETVLTPAEGILEEPAETGAQAPAATQTTTPEPAAQATPVEPKPAVDPKKVVRSPQPPPKTFVDILMDNIIWVGAGLAAIIIGAFLALRRRADANAEDGDIDEFDQFDDQVFAGADEPLPEPVQEPEELAVEDVAEAYDEPEPTEIVAPDDEPVEAETSDVVGEADIYIAYGKFDQAEDMLRKVLVDNPARTDVRTKLLEVFSESNQLQKFDQEYAQLLTYDDAAANARAVELRNQIPDAGEFNPNAAAEALVEGDDGELSLELDLDDQSTGGETADFDDIDLDLDLDTDLESDSQLDAGLSLEDETADLAAADDGFDLELDLSEGTDGDDALAGSLEDDSTTLELDDDLGDADLDLELDTGELNTDLAADLDNLDNADLDLTLDDLAEDSATAADDVSEDLELALPEAQDVAATAGDDNLDDFADEFGDSLDDALDSDDFDLDGLDDVDMAALDQEVDALAAGLEDDDDIKPGIPEPVTEFEEPAAAAPEPASPAANDAEEEVFGAALSAVADNGGDSVDLADENAELDFLADTDEAATKLDLARAYIDMGDKDGAKDILDEVAEEGNDQQRQEAQELLSRM
ncbi:FimV family protein [Exilibacterium tricleocarpae]|uniref:FimV family protein n=1 Tax=Exilibacterium tricleocarpae TaxID=2591008 RepID=A0A545SRS9_9GAMM|nr:FimV/HubP family polar landmark protein [Exilibacterium tricleocarpae]TQV67691.1 FimV family protein [Exilibacterium tricleocarpae]